MTANAMAAIKRLKLKVTLIFDIVIVSDTNYQKPASMKHNKPKKTKQVSGSVKKAIKQMKIAHKQSKAPKKK